MNTFWLKVAGLVVVVVVIIVLVDLFSTKSQSVAEPEPEPEQKTFSEVAAEDRERLSAEPEKVEDIQEHEPVRQQAAEPVELYFRELSEIEKIEAERLFNVAVPGRSIGRLPATGFQLMVDSCRQIVERWPDSWYAYRAKQMLAEMPPRFRQRYNVTEKEMDLSIFAEPRPGTKPFTIEESN